VSVLCVGTIGAGAQPRSHEIIEQYVRGAALGQLARSVVMGMGEPLLNYANLARRSTSCTTRWASARARSRCRRGLPDRLREARAVQAAFQLAISLHTADQEQRDVLRAGDEGRADRGACSPRATIGSTKTGAR
jgi:adenine C2-methylase RlmN of 23S rRNA A2503 and tRNA A37